MIIHVRIGCLQEIRGLNAFVSNGLAHAVVVFAWHHQVHIVVPGNEALVANGTEQRAALGPATQVVGLTILEKTAEQIELYGLHLLHFGAGYVPVGGLLVCLRGLCILIRHCACMVDATYLSAKLQKKPPSLIFLFEFIICVIWVSCALYKKVNYKLFAYCVGKQKEKRILLKHFITFSLLFDDKVLNLQSKKDVTMTEGRRLRRGNGRVGRPRREN